MSTVINLEEARAGREKKEKIPSDDTSLVRGRFSETIEELLPLYPYFYPDRISWGSWVLKFFASIASSWIVYIISSAGDSIDRAMLSVISPLRQEYELSALEFIRLTHPDGKIANPDDAEQHILNVLDHFGVRVSFGASSRNHESFEDMPGFYDFRNFPSEAVSMSGVNESGNYSFHIWDKNGIWDVDPSDFCDPDSTPVLYLMVHFYQCYAPKDSVSVALHAHEDLEFAIPSKLFVESIILAIKRKYPLYVDYPQRDLISRFYRTMVVPTLSVE